MSLTVRYVHITRRNEPAIFIDDRFVSLRFFEHCRVATAFLNGGGLIDACDLPKNWIAV